MSRSYVIQKKDTLRKIAKNFYNDAKLSNVLADYNGILHPETIRAGQTIEIPSKRELERTDSELVSTELGISPPNGLQQILGTFGNIYDYIKEDGTLDPRWETDQLDRALLPFSIPLSWDHTKSVSSIYTHKKLIGIVLDVFNDIEKEGMVKKIQTFGGCFNLRSKRTSGKLSTHSWGIAIDLNPDTNMQGKPGDMEPGVVTIFRQFGFTWGGDWSGKTKDPMHFQFCTGY